MTDHEGIYLASASSFKTFLLLFLITTDLHVQQDQAGPVTKELN